MLSESRLRRVMAVSKALMNHCICNSDGSKACAMMKTHHQHLYDAMSFAVGDATLEFRQQLNSIDKEAVKLGLVPPRGAEIHQTSDADLAPISEPNGPLTVAQMIERINVFEMYMEKPCTCTKPEDIERCKRSRKRSKYYADALKMAMGNHAGMEVSVRSMREWLIATSEQPEKEVKSTAGVNMGHHDESFSQTFAGANPAAGPLSPQQEQLLKSVGAALARLLTCGPS